MYRCCNLILDVKENCNVVLAQALRLTQARLDESMEEECDRFLNNFSFYGKPDDKEEGINGWVVIE